MAFITIYLNGVIILTALIIAVYLYTMRKYNYWKKRDVFVEQPIPFFGNFTKCILLQKSPGFFLKDLYDLGKGLPYIGFYVLDKPCLLIRDRELIKNVLVKDFNYFVNRYGSPDTSDRFTHAILFFLKNPTWKFLRTKLSPFFTSGKLKRMFELMLECGNNLDMYLESLKLEGKGMELEIKEMAAKFGTDIIGTTAYGLNVNSLNNPDVEFRKYGKMIFNPNIIRGFQILSLFFFPKIIRMFGIKGLGKEPSAFLRKVFWETIVQRIESGGKRNDLIDILVELKKTYEHQDIEGFTFDGDDLAAQAGSFFIASYETSSTTITFILYELAIHPEIQGRLRKEILDALDETDGKITYDMVSSLLYLDMVISEGLRMYPSLPFLDRETIKDYKVPNSDLVIEKGTPIYVSMTGVHYDPEYFPDPHKFDPERFTGENKRNRPSCVFFPFGEGPRACIGSRMGLLQIKLGLITILSKYEVTPSERTLIPMIIDPQMALTTPLGSGLYLKIRKINQY